MFTFYFVYTKHQVLLICNENERNLCCQFDDTIEVYFLLGINIWGLRSEWVKEGFRVNDSIVQSAEYGLPYGNTVKESIFGRNQKSAPHSIMREHCGVVVRVLSTRNQRGRGFESHLVRMPLDKAFTPQLSLSTQV